MTPRNSRDTNPLVRIPEVMRSLQELAIKFRIIEAQSTEADNIIDWLESHFPIIGMQIEWSKIPNHRCMEWSGIEELVKEFARMIQRIPAATPVVVTWSDALYPSLEVAFGDVVKIAQQVFESSFDTWIICHKENWCMEIHHEGTICFGNGRPDLVFLGAKERS